MTENRMRIRAERGEVQIGTWITMVRTPGILTLLQAAGLDFARVDMEHGAFSMETVADMAALGERNLAVLYQADVGTGAADIDGDDVLDAARRRDVARADHAGGRP